MEHWTVPDVKSLYPLLAGPGPLAYNLPTTVGQKEHDPTKRINPAWTIRPKYQGNDIQP